MGDDLMDIPIPSGGEEKQQEQPEAWKKAMEELNKVSKKNNNGNNSSSNGNAGHNGMHPPPHGMFPPWMNPNHMNANNFAGAYEFGGGWQPSAWDNPIPPPPQQQNFNHQHQPPFAYQQYQQNWNNGRGRGRGGKQPNWNMQQQQQHQQQQQGPNRFQPFALNRKNNTGIPHLTNSFVPQGGPGQNGLGQGGFGRGAPPMGGAPKAAPASATRYIERAYESANTEEDRRKTQEYILKRLQPMINAGTAHTINWDNEPLPHERNYELPTMWTPANKLNLQANGFYRKGGGAPSSIRRRSGENDNSAGGPNESKRSRRDSSSSGSDIIEISSKRKKTKAEKKAEKAAKKAEKQKKNNQNQNKWKVDYENNDSEAKREERAKRFAQTLSTSSQPRFQAYFRKGQKDIRGTCQDIEKPFFRLTSEVDPSTVRPLEVLRLSLDNVKHKYRQKAEYRYLESQLRAIRQDLTVQRIRNEFTVQVYEINARISLENRDREEFNKCQSQLKLLYNEIEDCPNHAEFIGYRLLYYVAMQDYVDITSLLKELTPELENDDCVSFALKVEKAVSIGNFVKFFKLFDTAPKMCPFIMDLFVERERKKALNAMTKSFKPTLAYSVISKFLAVDEELLVEWLKEDCEVKDAVVGGVLDCRVGRVF